jgi:hypothetical protein
VSEVARMPYILAKVFPALPTWNFNWYQSNGSFNIVNVSEPALQEVCDQLCALQGLPGQDDYDGNYDSDMEW